MNETNATSTNASVVNAAISGINLDASAHAHVRRSTNSSTLETIFETGGAGFVGSMVHATVSLSSAGEIRFYDNAIADSNLLAVADIEPGKGKMVCGSPCFFSDNLIVQAKSDGAFNVDAHIWIVAGQPVANTSLTADKMTYINGNAATSNFGTLTAAECRYAVGQNKRVLLDFNLASLPVGFAPSVATLSLFASNTATPSNDVKIFKILKPWTELGVTWNTRDGSIAWSTAGLGAGTDKSAAADLSIDLGTYTSGTQIDIDLLAIVTDWLSGAVLNYGLILQFDTLAGANSFIPNTDDASAALRPTLLIQP